MGVEFYQELKIETETQSLEQLGTKEKYWLLDTDRKEKFLFKIGRPNTGENWSEKVSGELADLLGLPCAKYDFASMNERKGVVSYNFVPKNGRLVHGMNY